MYKSVWILTEGTARKLFHKTDIPSFELTWRKEIEFEWNEKFDEEIKWKNRRFPSKVCYKQTMGRFITNLMRYEMLLKVYELALHYGSIVCIRHLGRGFGDTVSKLADSKSNPRPDTLQSASGRRIYWQKRPRLRSAVELGRCLCMETDYRCTAGDEGYAGRRGPRARRKEGTPKYTRYWQNGWLPQSSI